MTKIIPAVLPGTLEELHKQLSTIRGAAHSVQIDLVDGVLAPSKTWPYDTGDWKERLPFADEFEFEMDLMVEKAEDAAEFWRQAGAKRIVIHIESPDAREALLAAAEREEADRHLVSIRSTEIGIALPCSASPEVLQEYAGLYDYVQVMGIERIGFQGQPFDARAIELVRALRRQFPELPIQVDGGVGESNVGELAAAGANRLVVGSAIWESDDPTAEIKKLKSIVYSL